MNRLIQLKTLTPLFFIVLLLACFGPVRLARAVLPAPSPDGGYLNANTAEGDNALHDLTTGVNNTALGASALHSNTIGGYNVAIGAFALGKNVSGQQNMAIGADALANSIGSFNMAIGFRVGYLNTTGGNLTGVGAAALRNNTTGSNNTAIGEGALFSNTNAGDNTAIGAESLNQNNGTSNVAVGSQALMSNTSGIHNTACGTNAMDSNSGGGFNIAIGSFAGSNLTNGSNNIEIGHPGFPGEHNTIRIGSTNGIATFIDGIYGVNIGGPNVQVFVTSGGQLGTNPSSRRFKTEIKPMDRVSEAILALKPVIFRYKTDSTGTAEFGLIAEEVAEVNSDLVVRDKEDKPYSVRYDQVNAMLLNEFLKEHRKVEEQEVTILRLQKGMQTVIARLEEQQSELRRVSAQLEVTKSAPQTVLISQ